MGGGPANGGEQNTGASTVGGSRGGVGGRGEHSGGSAVGGGGVDVGPPPDLSEVPCEPYRPSASAWSSLPLSRPATIGQLSIPASGDYLYTAGTWLDAGRLSRSDDSGATWSDVQPDLEVTAVVDDPEGGFLAATQYGLVHFD